MQFLLHHYPIFSIRKEMSLIILESSPIFSTASTVPFKLFKILDLKDGSLSDDMLIEHFYTGLNYGGWNDVFSLAYEHPSFLLIDHKNLFL